MRFRFKLDKINSFGCEIDIISLGHFNETSNDYDYAMTKVFESEAPCLMEMISDYLRGWSNEWYNIALDTHETHHCECCGSYVEDSWSWRFTEKEAKIVASWDGHFGYSYGFKFNEIRTEFKKIRVEVEFDESMYEIGE